MAKSGSSAASGTTARFGYGPRSLAALLPDVTRRAIGQRGTAATCIALDWAVIAGAHLAAASQPRKLAGGTLTVACAGPAAMELRYAADRLIERVNRHLGRAVVARLRLVHDVIGKPPRPPAPADPTVIDPRLAGMPEGPVRQALSALAAAMPDG